MSKKFVHNLFFVIGITAVIYLIYTFDLSWSEVVSHVTKGGIYFPLIIILWFFIYLVNTCSWNRIVKGLKGNTIPFRKLYRYTVSGFALNYITPGGLMGGELYRILKLKPYLGSAGASSSTLLYVVCHIGSHLMFWFIAAVVLLFHPLQGLSSSLLWIVLCLLSLLALFFHLAMRYGVVELMGRLLRYLPFINRRSGFVVKLKETFKLIDEEVRDFYLSNSKNFWSAFFLEFTARIIGCLEVWLLLIPFEGFTSFSISFLVMAISSLFANILFFMPMQIGGREGGFALAFSLLSLPASYGVLIALLTRLREFVWIVIGVLYMKWSGDKTD